MSDNGRGTAEQWIKEGKYAVKWTRLSCQDVKNNQMRLQLFALAYNLASSTRERCSEAVKHGLEDIGSTTPLQSRLCPLSDDR